MSKRGGSNGPRCSKHCKNGSPCQGTALKGKDYCRMHGGTDGGRAPVTAEHSRYVPEHLLEDFQRALQDPGLHSLDFEIAGCESRMSELWRGMEKSLPHSEAWVEAEKLYRDAVSSSPSAQASMAALGRLITDKEKQHLAWEEWQDLADLRRRLLHTETVKLEKLDQFMTKREAAALGAAIFTVFRKYIPDRNQCDMGIAEVAGLMNRRRSLPKGR